MNLSKRISGIERSIGKKGTNELAVMIDPFHPVMITKAAMELEVDDYYKSWMGYAPEVEASTHQ